MQVHGIIERKGDRVVTVSPEDPVRAAVMALSENGFGALVVSSNGSSIDGIISERDIVRHLGREGTSVLEHRVKDIMTSPVKTCSPDDTVAELMSRMTEHRIRHLPVEVDGALSGMISIGDVVKWRVTELEQEMGHLENYIRQGW